MNNWPKKVLRSCLLVMGGFNSEDQSFNHNGKVLFERLFWDKKVTYLTFIYPTRVSGKQVRIKELQLNVWKSKLVCDRETERQNKVSRPTETSVSSHRELLWTLTNSKCALAQLVLALAANKLVVNKLEHSAETQANRCRLSARSSEREKMCPFVIISFLLKCRFVYAKLLLVCPVLVSPTGSQPCFNELSHRLTGQLQLNLQLTVVSNR